MRHPPSPRRRHGLPSRRAVRAALVLAVLLSAGAGVACDRAEPAAGPTPTSGATSAPQPTGPRGPSSSRDAEVVSTDSGTSLTAILSVGDSAGPYRFAGKADGLGAVDNGDGTFTVLVDHEFGVGYPVVHRHGAPGAFVSRWTIRTQDLAVLSGEDLVTRVMAWTPAGYRQTQVTFDRLCSADLPAASALVNDRTGAGYPGRMLLNGEESGSEGRAFAHLLDGTSYQLPRLGRFSWENVVLNPGTGDTTVAVGTDDTTDGQPGQVYVYVGTKQRTGNPVERAGLTNGVLYGVKVAGAPFEPADTPFRPATAFTLHPFGDVSTWSGQELQGRSEAAGVTGFRKPEDAAWDPSHPGDLYFVTSDRMGGRSRLWRLRFTDPTAPHRGGRIDAVLTGTEGQQMLDNLTITRQGRIILQEDPGADERLARIWSYQPGDRQPTELARAHPRRFRPGQPDFVTSDEETSGVIDVSSILGPGTFVLTSQAHDPAGRDEAEGGQLLLLRTR